MHGYFEMRKPIVMQCQGPLESIHVECITETIAQQHVVKLLCICECVCDFSALLFLLICMIKGMYT